MVDKTHHIRERFYRGLRKEIHSRLTPLYEDKRTPYVMLIKKARELEEEYCPTLVPTAKGARDNPQIENVIKDLEGDQNTDSAEGGASSSPQEEVEREVWLLLLWGARTLEKDLPTTIPKEEEGPWWEPSSLVK